MENHEPNLNEIDDYSNQESPKKRRTVWIVVTLCLVIGAAFALSRGYFTEVNDELVPKQETGIPKY